jgi:hypothetical protein
VVKEFVNTVNKRACVEIAVEAVFVSTQKIADLVEVLVSASTEGSSIHVRVISNPRGL